MFKPITILGGQKISAMTIVYVQVRQEDEKPPNKIRLHTSKTLLKGGDGNACIWV